MVLSPARARKTAPHSVWTWGSGEAFKKARSAFSKFDSPRLQIRLASGGGDWIRRVRGEPADRGDLDLMAIIADPEDPVLDVDVQVHGPGSQGSQCGALFGRQVPDGQIFEARKPGVEARPPLLSGLAEAKHAHVCRAGTHALKPALLGESHINPVLHGTGEIPLPEARFISIPKVLGEFQMTTVGVCRDMEQEGHEAHHETLIGLFRMAGKGEGKVGVKMAVHVREVGGNLEDGGFHGGKIPGHSRASRGRSEWPK